VRRALFAGLLLAAAGGAAAADGATPASAAAAGPPAPALMPFAYVMVDDGDCGSADADWPAEQTVTWVDDDTAELRRVLTLSSRERVFEGPVDVVVRGGRVFAWIPTEVEAIVPGEPVPTCLHSLLLELVVDNVPNGDSEWVRRQGGRADDTTFEQDVAAAEAAKAEAAAASGKDD
jgi:hypothetical protein